MLSKQATGPHSIIDPMSLVVITKKDGTFVSAAILMMRSCPLRVAKDSQTILSQQPTFQMIKIKRCGRRHQPCWMELMRPSFSHNSSNHGKQILNKGDFPFFSFDPDEDPFVIRVVKLPGQQSLSSLDTLIDTFGTSFVSDLEKTLASMSMFEEFRKVNAFSASPDFLTLKFLCFSTLGAGEAGPSSNSAEGPVDTAKEDDFEVAACNMAAQSALNAVSKAFYKFRPTTPSSTISRW